MKDEVDLELREDALENRPVQDRTDELPGHEPAQLRIERLEVERQDGARAIGGEARDEPVADLPAGPRDEDDGTSHATVTSLLR